ncbi:unnamed protein product [Dicrocoelium dendriticum]|nr:unnamed protein product [Dicrocoelium dendriticum]
MLNECAHGNGAENSNPGPRGSTRKPTVAPIANPPKLTNEMIEEKLRKAEEKREKEDECTTTSIKLLVSKIEVAVKCEEAASKVTKGVTRMLLLKLDTVCCITSELSMRVHRTTT